MTKTITDKWPIRYMRLDDEVYEAVMRLKEKYGSPNKGLKAVLLDETTCRQCGCTHASAYELGRSDERLAQSAATPVKELKVEYDER